MPQESINNDDNHIIILIIILPIISGSTADTGGT